MSEDKALFDGNKYDKDFVETFVPIIRKMRDQIDMLETGIYGIISMNECLKILNVGLNEYKKLKESEL